MKESDWICKCGHNVIKATGFISGDIYKYRIFCPECKKRLGYYLLDTVTGRTWVK